MERREQTAEFHLAARIVCEIFEAAKAGQKLTLPQLDAINKLRAVAPKPKGRPRVSAWVEAQVRAAIAAGRTHKEIADEIGVGISTQVRIRKQMRAEAAQL